MLRFLLIFLLVQQICANPGYRNYKPRYYGPQKGYGYQRQVRAYKKPVDSYKKLANDYKKPVTAVAPYCRCIKGTTMMKVIILDQAGTPMSSTPVWVSFQGQIKETKTDQKGFVRVDVKGCEVGIIVWDDGKQVEYRTVNLEKTTTNHKNVVIQIGKACNFLIYLRTVTEPTATLIHKEDLIAYLADVNGGEQSTSGTAVLGENTSPLCINVENGGSLKIVATSQSADLISVLCLNEVEEGEEAVLGLPLPISFLFSRIFPADTFSLVVATNVYRTVDEGLIPWNCMGPACGDGEGMVVQYVDGDEVKTVESGAFDIYAVVHNDVLENTNYLISVKLAVEGTDWSLTGNAYILDIRGVTQVVKIPPEDYPVDGMEPYWWVLGCMFNGDLKKFKEINKFSEILPQTDDEFVGLCEDGIVVTSTQHDEHTKYTESEQEMYEFEYANEGYESPGYGSEFYENGFDNGLKSYGDGYESFGHEFNNFNDGYDYLDRF